MSNFRKILLAAGCLILLVQVPFALNRYRTARLASSIEQLRKARSPALHPGFRDYKGVLHVHSFIGGHSTGTFDELIKAADENGLDFVLMTEHVAESFDSASKTLNGKHGRAVWIGGNEASTGDGDKFLVPNGFEGIHGLQYRPTDEFLDGVQRSEGLALVTYPERFKSWDSAIDGIEVFSLHTTAKDMNPFLFFFDALWSYGAYPELTFARHFRRPDENLARYDQLSARGRLLLFAGSDAHSNLGVHLVGDDANNKLLELKFDRYSTIFRLVRTHVLLPEETGLDRRSVLDALACGRAYVALDLLGDPTGFSFFSETPGGISVMGSEIESHSARLRVVSPLPARIVILRNGEKVFEAKSAYTAEYTAGTEGAYRVEAYLDSLGSPFDEVPWVMTNPIYLRRQADAEKPAPKPTNQN